MPFVDTMEIKNVIYDINGGGGGSVNWGSIGGDISNQTDLADELADKVDKVTGKGLSTNDYTDADKSKLAGIASGAEVNVQSDWNQSDTSADDFIKNKPSIPSLDNYYTKDETDAEIAGYHDPTKQDAEAGKGLSTNDYTTADKNKLAGIASGAEVNVQSDWGQSDISADDYIKNKPTIPTLDDYYTKAETDAEIANHHDATKQDTLVSGTNIKTINNQSLLGSGNIDVGGGGTSDYDQLSNKPQINSVELTGDKSSSDLGLIGVGDDAEVNSLTIGDHETPVGWQTQATASSTTIPASETDFVNLTGCKITIPQGAWMIMYRVNFPSTGTSACRKGIRISNVTDGGDAPFASSTITVGSSVTGTNSLEGCICTRIDELTNVDWQVQAMCDRNSSMTITTGYIRAMRIA